MRRIIYDFAMTVDGFIGHADGSGDGFVSEGEHVDDYFARLEKYDTVLMGRRTYEFGYSFGLKPGERAYEHMDHYLFSDSLNFDSGKVNVVNSGRIDIVQQVKGSDGGDIYLCGGGLLAGFLLEHELIDRLIVKLNPVTFGDGIRPFGTSLKRVTLTLSNSKTYDNGVMLLEYNVNYGGRSPVSG